MPNDTTHEPEYVHTGYKRKRGVQLGARKFSQKRLQYPLPPVDELVLDPVTLPYSRAFGEIDEFVVNYFKRNEHVAEADRVFFTVDDFEGAVGMQALFMYNSHVLRFSGALEKRDSERSFTMVYCPDNECGFQVLARWHDGVDAFVVTASEPHADECIVQRRGIDRRLASTDLDKLEQRVVQSIRKNRNKRGREAEEKYLRDMEQYKKNMLRWVEQPDPETLPQEPQLKNIQSLEELDPAEYGTRVLRMNRAKYLFRLIPEVGTFDYRRKVWMLLMKTTHGYFERDDQVSRYANQLVREVYTVEKSKETDHFKPAFRLAAVLRSFQKDTTTVSVFVENDGLGVGLKSVHLGQDAVKHEVPKKKHVVRYAASLGFSQCARSQQQVPPSDEAVEEELRAYYRQALGDTYAVKKKKLNKMYHKMKHELQMDALHGLTEQKPGPQSVGYSINANDEIADMAAEHSLGSRTDLDQPFELVGGGHDTMFRAKTACGVDSLRKWSDAVKDLHGSTCTGMFVVTEAMRVMSTAVDDPRHWYLMCEPLHTRGLHGGYAMYYCYVLDARGNKHMVAVCVLPPESVATWSYFLRALKRHHQLDGVVFCHRANPGVHLALTQVLPDNKQRFCVVSVSRAIAVETGVAKWAGSENVMSPRRAFWRVAQRKDAQSLAEARAVLVSSSSSSSTPVTKWLLDHHVLWARSSNDDDYNELVVMPRAGVGIMDGRTAQLPPLGALLRVCDEYTARAKYVTGRNDLTCFYARDYQFTLDVVTRMAECDARGVSKWRPQWARAGAAPTLKLSKFKA